MAVLRASTENKQSGGGSRKSLANRVSIVRAASVSIADIDSRDPDLDVWIDLSDTLRRLRHAISGYLFIFFYTLITFSILDGQWLQAMHVSTLLKSMAADNLLRVND
jgi:hypothetical protein